VSPAVIEVLLVDDHAVVREGYRRLLESTGQIRVCGEAADAETACRLFAAQRFDVVVMDITLPGASGLEGMRRMLARDAGARVLIFSMHEEAVFAARALQFGAMGYVTKSSAPDVLVDAVRTVARGGRYLAAGVAAALARVPLAPDLRAALSEREFEVLQLLVNGRTLAEVAELLHLSGKTVANYQTSLREKLGADNAFQLMRLAIEHGLLVLPRAAGGTTDSESF
jgi:two-component system invasion response regulator UvrY